MKIIYNTKNYKGAKTLLFGLKDLSTYENEISLEELNKYKDKEIYLALDKNMFNEDLPKLEESLKEIDKLNIKGILFYDLAVLHISKRLNLKTPLIWNQNFLVTNYKTCNFYEKQNIKDAVISGEITIEEIEQLAKNTKTDLYINAFGYQLMAISKRKLITNYFNHTKEKNQEKAHKMIEKENSYPIIENETCTKIYTKEVLNAVKYLNRLKQAGIKYIILNDILLDEEKFNKVAKIYEEALNKNETDQELLEREMQIKDIINNTSTLFLDKKTIYKVKRK